MVAPAGLDGLAEEGLAESSDERALLTSAVAAEVVVVQRPDHDPAEALGEDVAGLFAEHLLIVEANPLAVLEGVRAHALGVRSLQFPAVLVDVLANLL